MKEMSAPSEETLSGDEESDSSAATTNKGDIVDKQKKRPLNKVVFIPIRHYTIFNLTVITPIM